MKDWTLNSHIDNSKAVMTENRQFRMEKGNKENVNLPMNIECTTTIAYFT